MSLKRKNVKFFFGNHLLAYSELSYSEITVKMQIFDQSVFGSDVAINESYNFASSDFMIKLPVNVTLAYFIPIFFLFKNAIKLHTHQKCVAHEQYKIHTKN